MSNQRRLTLRVLGIVFLLTTAVLCVPTLLLMQFPPKLLTDPFLQLPTENSVRVIWFTEFPGIEHQVNYGENLEKQAIATTTQLSRTREDARSHIGEQSGDGQLYPQTTHREIWRHEAEITGLSAGDRIPYRVTSLPANGQPISSEIFSLTPKPLPGTPLKILLTSDHQLKAMTAANLQKVVETVGQVDGIFFAGDLVNIPDRASEWFDDRRGNAFFPVLQGRAHFEINNEQGKIIYHGGALIQNAPLYPALGNHEVMGRFSMETSLNDQFNDPYPRAAAAKLSPHQFAVSAAETPLKNASYNTDTYEEIFTLPESKIGGKQYYSVTFGDIRLIVLYATNMWRSPDLNPKTKGKYREREVDFNHPENWGYGQHIFEPIAKGSAQYNWLVSELNHPEFQQAKYKIVMLHHPPHSLGFNVVPPYTNPIQIIERNAAGEITDIRYEYPPQDDYLIRDVMPLLEQAGVQLVFYGHSHLWNRFISERGMHFLESSNVGNSYGAHFGENQRQVPLNYQETYVQIGDPNGLDPVVPTLAPLVGEDGQILPYLADDHLTAFSIFETGTGSVSSYYFDTKQPNLPVVKFDEFRVK